MRMKMPISWAGHRMVRLHLILDATWSPCLAHRRRFSVHGNKEEEMDSLLIKIGAVLPSDVIVGTKCPQPPCLNLATYLGSLIGSHKSSEQTPQRLFPKAEVGSLHFIHWCP